VEEADCRLFRADELEEPISETRGEFYTTVVWVDLLGQRRVICATRRQVRHQPTLARNRSTSTESHKIDDSSVTAER